MNCMVQMRNKSIFLKEWTFTIHQIPKNQTCLFYVTLILVAKWIFFRFFIFYSRLTFNSATFNIRHCFSCERLFVNFYFVFLTFSICIMYIACIVEWMVLNDVRRYSQIILSDDSFFFHFSSLHLPQMDLRWNENHFKVFTLTGGW